MAKFIQSGKVAQMFPRGNLSPPPARGGGPAQLVEGGFPIGHPLRNAPSATASRRSPPRAGEDHQDTIIHTAIPIIMRFSVSDRKPSGTLLDPPTQAHLSSRRSI